MSNMGNIIKKLKKYEIDISSKNEWKNILLKNKRELADNIIKGIQEVLGKDESKPQNIVKRQTYEVSVVEKDGRKRIYRIEEGLERLICKINQDINSNIGWGNQIKINKEKCAKKEYVDLIQYDKQTDKITCLIELKAWDNKKDNPIYAIIELLKNYFLCDAFNRKSVKSLVLLAPKEYYEIHGIINNKDFEAFINELSTQLDVNIEVKKINLNANDWKKFVNEKLPDSLKLTERKTKKYDKVTLKEDRLNIEKCVDNKIFSDKIYLPLSIFDIVVCNHNIMRTQQELILAYTIKNRKEI